MGGGGAHALLLSYVGAFLLLVLLLLVPAWPIKPQSLVFPSPFCLASYALPFLLELEGLLSSVISFLVNFFTFSLPLAFQLIPRLVVDIVCLVGPTLWLPC